MIWNRERGDLKEVRLDDFVSTSVLIDSAGPLEVGELSFVESFLRFGKMFSKRV